MEGLAELVIDSDVGAGVLFVAAGLPHAAKANIEMKPVRARAGFLRLTDVDMTFSLSFLPRISG
jgi:hypothetical protein